MSDIYDYDGNSLITNKGEWKIFYYGTPDDFDEMMESIDNDEGYEFYILWIDLTEYIISVYYYSEAEPVSEGNYWHYDDDGNPAVW